MNQGTLFGDNTQQLGSYGEPLAVRPSLSGERLLFFSTIKEMDNIPRTANEVAARAIPFDGREVVMVIADRYALCEVARSLLEDGWIRQDGERLCRVTMDEAMTYEVIK